MSPRLFSTLECGGGGKDAAGTREGSDPARSDSMDNRLSTAQPGYRGQSPLSEGSGNVPPILPSVGEGGGLAKVQREPARVPTQQGVTQWTTASQLRNRGYRGQSPLSEGSGNVPPIILYLECGGAVKTQREPATGGTGGRGPCRGFGGVSPRLFSALGWGGAVKTQREPARVPTSRRS